MKNKILLLLILLNSSFLFGQAISPDQLKDPKFNATDFVIDPQNGIKENWLEDIYGARSTYFYPRYIEPVVVRLNDIKSPSNIDKYADKLVDIWDLEDASEGRYVLQLVVLDQQDITYRFGSKVQEFYIADSVETIRQDIIDVHLYDGAEGTGSFVSISSLGALIFQEIKYDADRTADDVSGTTHEYPAEIIPSYGELTTIGSPSSNEYPMDDVIGAENYYSGFTDDEISSVYDGIKQLTVEDYTTIQNIREINNTNVNDPHNLLHYEAIDTINSIITLLEEINGYQTSVVCLNSIGDNNPRDFGTELFNHWGIGQSGSDNGLLLLLVNDVHRIEFITGRGTEIILTDALCYNIQQEEMVPYFKNNDYSTGMIRGMQAVYDALNGAAPDYSYTSSNSDYDTPVYDDDYSYGSRSIWDNEIVQFYLTFMAILSGFYFIFLIVALLTKNLHSRYKTLKFWTLLIFPILFPFPFLIFYILSKSLMTKWRDTVRVSSKNGLLMHKLSETIDNEFLSKGQVTEEQVKSIDYDVWVTDDESDILILAYKRWFSKYRKCSSCKAKTYFKVYDKTISSPTYSSSGTGERMYRCENCGVKHVSTYTIPKLQKSSSSSSGGGSYGGGSSYSGGSSSSGGSSYGGGSSRGGGSGSSW